MANPMLPSFAPGPPSLGEKGYLLGHTNPERAPKPRRLLVGGLWRGAGVSARVEPRCELLLGPYMGAKFMWEYGRIWLLCEWRRPGVLSYEYLSRIGNFSSRQLSAELEPTIGTFSTRVDRVDGREKVKEFSTIGPYRHGR